MFALGAVPRLPAAAAVRSLSTSPKRLLATITSSESGALTTLAASASTSMLWASMSGKSAETSSMTSSQKGIA
jgi:hypothetical protein